MSDDSGDWDVLTVPGKSPDAELVVDAGHTHIYVHAVEYRSFRRLRDVAQLIAAAPALLAACEELLDAMKRYEWDSEGEPTVKHMAMRHRAEDAIAKARDAT